MEEKAIPSKVHVLSNFSKHLTFLSMLVVLEDFKAFFIFENCKFTTLHR